MLDSDLAELYNVETKRINEAVYRNKEKFPKRISWITNDNEVSSLWSQNATANTTSMPQLLHSLHDCAILYLGIKRGNDTSFIRSV